MNKDFQKVKHEKCEFQLWPKDLQKKTIRNKNIYFPISIYFWQS